MIPPKRQLTPTTAINLDEELMPNGEGTINKLFFLKNHDMQTSEYVTFRKIYDTFLQITNCSFNIIPQANNQLKLRFRVGEKSIDAEDCGLGLKDLLFLITFILSTDFTCYLVEEPENHLHADFQKSLLGFFKQLPDKQFIVSTHSNVFLDINKVDKIFYCWFEEEVKLSDKTSMSKIVDSLGYSVTENLTSDAIILTEGPTDIPIIKRALVLGGVLDDSNVKFWPLGGDIMGSLDLSLFSNVKNVFAIIDNDPGSSKIRNQFKKNCKEHNIACVQLKRYSIENYLHISLIKRVFPAQIFNNKIVDLDPAIPVDEQIGFKAKNKSIKGKNHLMASGLEKEHIEGSDLWDFVTLVRESVEKSHAQSSV